MSLPTTPAEAKALDLPRFLSDVPCKRGHLGERKTSNNDCCQCHALREDRRRRKKIREFTKGRHSDSCDVCGSTNNIVVDHDHETGAYRGHLCNHCNLVLGHSFDDPNVLRLLAGYLEKNKNGTPILETEARPPEV